MLKMMYKVAQISLLAISFNIRVIKINVGINT